MSNENKQREPYDSHIWDPLLEAARIGREREAMDKLAIMHARTYQYIPVLPLPTSPASAASASSREATTT